MLLCISLCCIRRVPVGLLTEVATSGMLQLCSHRSGNMVTKTGKMFVNDVYTHTHVHKIDAYMYMNSQTRERGREVVGKLNFSM